MDSARKFPSSRLFLLSLGLLTVISLTGCDFYAKKKEDQSQSQSEPKKEAPDGSDAEAGLEEGAPPTPEPPGSGAPSGEASQPHSNAPSSGNPSAPAEVPPPAVGEQAPPSESSGQGATPPKSAPENP